MICDARGEFFFFRIVLCSGQHYYSYFRHFILQPTPYRKVWRRQCSKFGVSAIVIFFTFLITV